MKKLKPLLAFLVTIMLLFSSVASQGIKESENHFPSALQELESEAFSGTSIQTVVLPDGFLSIGDEVFLDVLLLRDVYIPSTTEQISDSAFPEDIEFVIYGVKKSYACGWAENNHIPFVVQDGWNVFLINRIRADIDCATKSIIYHNAELEKTTKRIFSAKLENKSKRPQDRAELNPIDYRFP